MSCLAFRCLCLVSSGVAWQANGQQPGRLPACSASQETLSPQSRSFRFSFFAKGPAVGAGGADG